MRAVLLGVVALASAAEGAPPRLKAEVGAEPPVVMMIRSAQRPEHRRREEKLYDELSVALDAFMVLSQPADRDDFHRLPLDEQIAAVLPDAKLNNAMAVVWLSFPLSNQVMLHLVALGSGRALIRTIETDRSSVSESSLALMARELLGTAYLFEPPRDVPLQVTEVVRSVKQQIPPEAPPPAPPPPPPPPAKPWSLWLQGHADAPLAGGADAVPVVGVRAALEKALPGGFDVSLAAVARYAGIPRADTGGAVFWSAGLALGAFRGFEAAGVALGPFATAGLSYARFTGGAAPLGLWLPRFEAGLQVRSKPTDGPNVAGAVAVAYSPLQAELVGPDDRALFRTASLELALGLSIGWQWR